MLPFLFWQVSVGRRRSPPSGAAELTRGDPLTCVSPRVFADVTLLPSVYFRPHQAPYRDAATWRSFSAPLSCLLVSHIMQRRLDRALQQRPYPGRS
jgi:hypothetical protein